MTSLKCYFRAKVHFSGTCREKVEEGEAANPIRFVRSRKGSNSMKHGLSWGYWLRCLCLLAEILKSIKLRVNKRF